MNAKSMLLLLLAAAWLSARAQSPPASRIRGPIDESRLVTLRGNVHPLAQARFDRGPAAASTATGRLTLALRRSAAQQEELRQYLADVQNPSSPNYRKWLTPAQYGARFGLSDADLGTIAGWLQSHGLKIEGISQAGNRIAFSGNFGEVESAFHTEIDRYRAHGKTYFANATDPRIPAALARVTAGVGPLNSFHPQPVFVAGPNGHWDATTHSIEPDLTLKDSSGNLYLFADPADAATIYDTPNAKLNPNYTGGATWDGSGVNIGIAGVSDLTAADVQNYREAFLGEISGAVNMPVQVVEGDDPGLAPGGYADEALLDNEIAGGMAPGAKIYYYAAADTDLSSGLLNAIFRAIDDDAVSILSASFVECESGLGTSGNQLMLEAAEQAAAEGISFVVASGDGGSAGCDDFDTESQAKLGFAVNGLASTPYTVAVGGTDFDALRTNFSSYVNSTSGGTAPYYRTALSYIPEEPWNDSTTVNTTLANNVVYLDSKGNGNIVAGSGGASSIYAKPPWQNPLTPNDNARDLPDVSFLAGNGFYRAAWVFCGDSVSDGSTSMYTACQTSGGQFTSSTVFEGVGGTSAAAPALAGMLALVSQAQGDARLGQPAPILYGLAASEYASVFHDVAIGNNSVPCAAGSSDCGGNGFLTGYDAGAGYDLASGLGSIDVASLIQNWTSVALAPTSTTLNLDGSTANYTGVHGVSITFNAGVTSSGTTPTGDIAIIDNANETSGGTSSGPQNNGQFVIALTNGTGSATYNGLPGGSYSVEARYGGDASNAASTSGPISVTISPEPSTIALQVNAYDPFTGATLGLVNMPYGSEVVADAQIEGAAEGAQTQGVATGTVTFWNGGPTLGTATVGGGNIASLPLLAASSIPPSAGPNTITAKYSGDASSSSSSNAGVSFTVTKAATSTAITTYPATVTAPQNFYLNVATTFLVSAEFGWPDSSPYYSVAVNGTSLGSFREGGDLGSTGSGISAHPVFLTEIAVGGQYLQQGQNVVTVTYTGGTNYTSSSASVNIDYTAGVGSFTLTNGGNISITAGLDGQSSLTLTPSGGFIGQVNFACSVSGAPAGVTCNAPPIDITSTAAASTTLMVITNSSMPAGSYTVSVTGSDAATGKITASTSLTLTVSAAPPGLSLYSGGYISIAPGATTGNTATITVTPRNGFTGAVNLSCSLVSFPAGASDLPTCSIASPVNITGPAGATATLTVITTAPTAASLDRRPGGILFGGGGLIFALAIFFGLPTRRRARRVLPALAAIMILTSAMTACGGGGGSSGGGGSGGGSGGGQSNPGTTPGGYTFTVKAADAATGQITASISVTVSVT